jgi:multiple sugar transport system permease protein
LTKSKMSFSLSSPVIAPYVFILPAVLILAGLIVYPTLLAVQTSIQTTSGYGLDNYFRALKDPLVWQTLVNTCIFTVISVIGHYILGLMIALLTNDKIFAKSFFRVGFLIPWMFPAVVPGIIWRWMLHGQFGIINSFLQHLGLIKDYVPWLVKPNTALIMVIIANIWRGYPLYVATLLAGLQTISKSLYEATEVDGANWFQSFWYVTLPQLKGVSIVMLLTDTIWQFNNFTMVQTMTMGGPNHFTEVLPTLIYKNAFNYNDYSVASVLGILLLLLMLIPGSFYVSHSLKKDSHKMD